MTIPPIDPVHPTYATVASEVGIVPLKIGLATSIALLMKRITKSLSQEI